MRASSLPAGGWPLGPAGALHSHSAALREHKKACSAFDNLVSACCSCAAVACRHREIKACACLWSMGGHVCPVPLLYPRSILLTSLQYAMLLLCSTLVHRADCRFVWSLWVADAHGWGVAVPVCAWQRPTAKPCHEVGQWEWRRLMQGSSHARPYLVTVRDCKPRTKQT